MKVLFQLLPVWFKHLISGSLLRCVLEVNEEVSKAFSKIVPFN